MADVERKVECIDESPCTIASCRTMKNIFNHILTCTKGTECTTLHCISSKGIIHHWDTCEDTACIVCQPFEKEKANLSVIVNTTTQQYEQIDIPETSNVDVTVPIIPHQIIQVPVAPNVSNNINNQQQEFVRLLEPSEMTATLSQLTKDWHHLVSHDLRNHFILKIVETLNPKANNQNCFTEQFSTLFVYSKGVENKLFMLANSKIEYFHFIAQKLYKIEQDLLQQNQLIPDIVTQTLQSNDINNIGKNGPNKQLELIPHLVSPVEPTLPPPARQKSPIEQLGNVIVEANNNNTTSTPRPTTTRVSGQSLPVKKLQYFSIKPSDLRKALKPVLEKLFCHPESKSFRNRIASIYNNNNVKCYIDLTIIKNKLDSTSYTDPWKFIDDVWLMFHNAWSYTESRIHDNATILSQVFVESMDPVMKSLGYCCGKKYEFNNREKSCCAKEFCTIKKNDYYYAYENNKYVFCEACFDGLRSDQVGLIGGKLMRDKIIIKKDKFNKFQNDKPEPENFVNCRDCDRKFHQICVCHLDAVSPEGYICDYCLRKKNQTRKISKFTAKNLPTTKLSAHIEKNINTFLRRRHCNDINIFIRVVESSNKIFKVKPEMKKKFIDNNNLPSEFPYRSKALFAFQEIDKSDVCFFGMQVQEYGSECRQPNTRRVYISCIDSVNFFKPKNLKTNIYHEIILGYLEYVKQLGYITAHIWARPLAPSDNYIFNLHPKDQKIPEAKQLQKWWKKLVGIGVFKKIVGDFKNIKQQIVEDGISSVTNLPYFKDDYWPDLLEHTIKNFQQDAGSVLWLRILGDMEQGKEAFFVIKLHGMNNATDLGPIEDPDPVINCNLMNENQGLLGMLREDQLEFSTLRRAKFSTLAILNEFHKPGEIHTSIDATKKVTIQRRVRSLEHSSHCLNKSCQSRDCKEFKHFIVHYRLCSDNHYTICQDCKELLNLSVCHTKYCATIKCPVPFCPMIKNKCKKKFQPQHTSSENKKKADESNGQSNAIQNNNSTMSMQQKNQITRIPSIQMINNIPQQPSTIPVNQVLPQFLPQQANIQWNQQAPQASNIQLNQPLPPGQLNMRLNRPQTPSGLLTARPFQRIRLKKNTPLMAVFTNRDVCILFFCA